QTGREYIPFMNRLSFAITSLKKAELIDHPKRGTTVLTKLGQEINPDNEEYIHELVMKGGLNYEIGCTSLKINSSKFQ
ncbi:winged helix-turn-helix domain-containing protein, partial [Limosilactobacillus reuteri]|uniref:winged helix-turn-helix domain-containing protein n=1 Tax=Limosilactobacillus reuteri TaxID=1598 RepID=UPI0015C59BDD